MLYIYFPCFCNLQTKYTIEISFFEIYNEKIHDLLASSTDSDKDVGKKRETVSYHSYGKHFITEVNAWFSISIHFCFFDISEKLFLLYMKFNINSVIFLNSWNEYNDLFVLISILDFVWSILFILSVWFLSLVYCSLAFHYTPFGFWISFHIALNITCLFYNQDKFWLNKEKLTGVGFKPATSGLIIPCI